MLVDGPRLQLWRAPTDNDGLPLLPDAADRACSAALARAGPRPPRAAPSSSPRRVDGNAIELVRRRGTTLVTHRHRYRLLADGELLVENEVGSAPELRDLPRVGVVLALAAGPRAARVVRAGAVGELLRPASRPAVVGTLRSTVADQYVPVHPPAGARPPQRRAVARADRRRGPGSRSGPADDRLQRRATSPPPTSPRRGTRATSSRAPRSSSASTTRSAASAPPAAAPTRHERYRLLEPSYWFAYVLRPMRRRVQPIGA